jgi:nicotinate-nucleotide--dimethylbenzimidazole phosphoribosyltransferase
MVQHIINTKTKPIGSLGKLEEIATQLCLIQNTQSPELKNPHMVVFAADHGIAKEGVSAYPSTVTWQMVQNFLADGAAINVFCKQHRLAIKIVDAGINKDIPPTTKLINQKIAYGTKNFFEEPAMTKTQVEACFTKSHHLISQLHFKQCNIVGFGEMGIGNTTTASMLMHRITNLPLEQCVGKGTGISEQQLEHKILVLRKARDNYAKELDLSSILATFGGFEIIQMAGAMLSAATYNMTILVDGFIASVAFLIAVEINPNIKHYAIFCHTSAEKGHQALLDYLNAKPILNLGLRLGEGTGVALAFPLIESACLFLSNMASFDSAQIDTQYA